jgi:hypothetical protein
MIERSMSDHSEVNEPAKGGPEQKRQSRSVGTIRKHMVQFVARHVELDLQGALEDGTEIDGRSKFLPSRQSIGIQTWPAADNSSASNRTAGEQGHGRQSVVRPAVAIQLDGATEFRDDHHCRRIP